VTRTAVVAIGGNALVADNEHSSIPDQFVAAHQVTRTLAAMIVEGWRVVVTHGNGPQVGFILRRSDLVARIAPEIPRLDLDLSVADSQGGIGYIVASSLVNDLRAAGGDERVAALITHTLVSAEDPAFQAPTKPIGSFYGREEAERLSREEGWVVVEDSGRGYRRVVPSPRPIRILEREAVAALLERGFSVVAAGGGGIPVVERPDGTYEGVEAVIDKDHASALLAAALGVDLLVLTTGVDQVAIDFGRPGQRFLDRMTIEEAERHLGDGQFPAGSMGPKVAAAIEFLRSGGREALITSPAGLLDALAGATGTRIVHEAGDPGDERPETAPGSVARRRR
jgi:carbamate kinase